MGNTYQPRWPAVFVVAAPSGLLFGAVAAPIGLLLGRGDPSLYVADWRDSPLGAACPA